MGTNPPSEKAETETGGGEWVECRVCGHSIGPGEPRPSVQGCRLCTTPSTSRDVHLTSLQQAATLPCTILPLPQAPVRPIHPQQLPHLPVSVGARRQLFKEDSPKGNRCSECGKTFASNTKFQQHLLTHTGERPFACDTCHKAFSSKFKLVRHVLIHSDTRQFVCLICNRTFHRKDHLKNHAKVHNPVKRRYKCEREDCQKEYSSSLSYRKHMAIHSAQDGNLECRMCGAVFINQQEVLQHLKVHSGSRSLKTQAEKKYNCNYCDRKFFTGKDVRRHLVVHTGNRDFECPHCSQKFGRKDHVVRHIKKSHTGCSKKRKRTTRSVGSIVEEVIGQTGAVQSSVNEYIIPDMDLPEEILAAAASSDENRLIACIMEESDRFSLTDFQPLDEDPPPQQ